MITRIYTFLVAGVILASQQIYAAPKNGSNIKKIIQKNGKVIVIIRENGKDKEVVLDDKDLKSIVKKKSSLNNKKTKEKGDKKADEKSFKKQSYHTVKSGDTLFSIAKKYKVAISDMLKVNKLSNKAVIHPGDTIKIPKNGYLEKAKKAVENNNKTVYKVKKGDTLSKIAKKFNISTKKLIKINNFKPNPKLKPGIEINVVVTQEVVKNRKKATKHVIKEGDTLWSIARKYGLTVAQLRELNPKIRKKGLRKGSVLRVSKKETLRLSTIYKKRKKRLSGLLQKYQRSGGSYNSRRVIAVAKRYLGSRYVWGGTRPGAFDCSGFTQYVMRKAKGKAIPRVSRRQAYYGRYVSRRNLRPGDLIFFDTSRRRRGYVNHVGIYIGNGRFIHASSGKHRVVITSLNKPFYRSRFMWGRRVN